MGWVWFFVESEKYFYPFNLHVDYSTHLHSLSDPLIFNTFSTSTSSVICSEALEVFEPRSYMGQLQYFFF